MGAPSCPEGAKPTFPRSASSIFVLRRLRPASFSSGRAGPNPREGFPSIRSPHSPSVAQSASVTYFIARRLYPLHNRSSRSARRRFDATGDNREDPRLLLLSPWFRAARSCALVQFALIVHLFSVESAGPVVYTLFQTPASRR